MFSELNLKTKEINLQFASYLISEVGTYFFFFFFYLMGRNVPSICVYFLSMNLPLFSHFLMSVSSSD